MTYRVKRNKNDLFKELRKVMRQPTIRGHNLLGKIDKAYSMWKTFIKMSGNIQINLGFSNNGGKE